MVAVRFETDKVDGLKLIKLRLRWIKFKYVINQQVINFAKVKKKVSKLVLLTLKIKVSITKYYNIHIQ